MTPGDGPVRTRWRTVAVRRHVPTTLSEADSKALLAAPRRAGAARAARARPPTRPLAAADELGYPVVAKLCGDAIAHKTERGLVRLGLADADAVRPAADRAAGRRPARRRRRRRAGGPDGHAATAS